MGAAHMYWTEQDDDRLRELITEHLSYAAIGAIMGRNKNSCIGRAHRLGIHNSKTKPTPKKKVAQAVERAVEKLFPPKPAPAQDNRPALLSRSAPLQPRYEQPEASTTAFGIPRTLLHLRANDCRFAVGERNGQHLFCCGQKLPGKPYCLDHAALCFREESQSLSRLMKAYR